ncbi:hypothetical protein, partial [Akkermansia sp.]
RVSVALVSVFLQNALMERVGRFVASDARCLPPREWLRIPPEFYLNRYVFEVPDAQKMIAVIV